MVSSTEYFAPDGAEGGGGAGVSSHPMSGETAARKAFFDPVGPISPSRLVFVQ